MDEEWKFFALCWDVLSFRYRYSVSAGALVLSAHLATAPPRLIYGIVRRHRIAYSVPSLERQKNWVDKY